MISFGKYTGFDVRGRPEIGTVKRALRAVGIPIDQLIAQITAVYGLPRPIGIEFICSDPAALRAAVVRSRQFGYDDPTTVTGTVESLVAHGESFRQAGLGLKLHVEVASDGLCDAHLDTSQIVAGVDPLGNTVYDFEAARTHFIWDLAPTLVPWAYVVVGGNTVVAPYLKPLVKPVDGGWGVEVGVALRRNF